MSITDDRPHSRACGIHKHDHGPGCHPNCPTCGGKAETTTSAFVAPTPPIDWRQLPWTPNVIDATHLERQRQWSRETFGPGKRTHGVLDHIRKELAEIEADPDDLGEWVDVIILAFDGAWRHGWEPQQIIDAIKAKQAKNEAREWPDWRTMSEDVAIEHDRSKD